MVRVHPAFLEAQHIPDALVTKKIWDQRYEDICCMEKYLSRNGFLVLKFFLNLSKKEQKKRFLSRLDEPGKNWKFSTADVKERGYWDDYMSAYEDMIRNTSSPNAPWYVVPADNKWYTRLVVSAAVVDALERLKLGYPKVDGDKMKSSRRLARCYPATILARRRASRPWRSREKNALVSRTVTSVI